MKIQCSSKHTNIGAKELKRSDYLEWIVEEKALYFCEALWGILIASWHAFQPKRDVGHRSVFWVAKQNGFFHSWDNSTWVRKSVWETE
ncbi:hypothetical protein L484_008286 [Morus notabilis]|uniref:Uncharacterized protein n=1 Tax=Morus notabilis TaxID=981085 RepID=W9RDR7_9ROSA|nr:hypothetical protein L484_008286 [Morus notabilis]